jgi:hypothetical protein
MLECKQINSTKAAKMGFLTTVAGYRLTDEENEGIRKDYKIKK